MTKNPQTLFAATNDPITSNLLAAFKRQENISPGQANRGLSTTPQAQNRGNQKKKGRRLIPWQFLRRRNGAPKHARPSGMPGERNCLLAAGPPGPRTLPFGRGGSLLNRNRVDPPQFASKC